MTIQETSHESFAHPYRGEPCTLDDDGLRVPYTGQSRMRLSLSSGLSQGRIVIDPAAHDLIAIRCGDGPLPRVRVASGEIAMSWQSSVRGWLRDLLGHHGRDVTIVLHPAVEWTIGIHGGLSHFDLDLTAGALARLDIHGGCCDVRIDLPQPKMSVPIRIASGVCQVLVQRPADTGIALVASGGMAGLRFDDQQFDALGGSTRLDSRNGVRGAPRYELQISGGAADLAIDTAGVLPWMTNLD